MAGGNNNFWEGLRKKARQLETELDLKLVSFSKLCTSYSGSQGHSSDSTALLISSSQDRMIDTIGVEIEELLAKLAGINDKMSGYTSTPGVTSPNAALMHTLQRHRDILQDYTHEFYKTKGNYLAVREREDLLGSLRKEIETYRSGTGVNNRRAELFLKENEHLRNIAMATKENMTLQRGMLRSIQSLINSLASRFPAISSLVQRINFRKRQDSLVLGGVVGICTILLLLYALH